MATRAEQILARKDQILSQEEEKWRLGRERQEFELQEEKRKKLEDEERKRQEEQRRILETRNVFETLGVMSIIDDLGQEMQGSSITYKKGVYEPTIYELCLYLSENKDEWISATYTPRYIEVKESEVVTLVSRFFLDILGNALRKVKKSIKHDPELKISGEMVMVVGKDGTLDDLIIKALAHPNFCRKISFGPPYWLK